MWWKNVYLLSNAVLVIFCCAISAFHWKEGHIPLTAPLCLCVFKPCNSLACSLWAGCLWDTLSKDALISASFGLNQNSRYVRCLRPVRPKFSQAKRGGQTQCGCWCSSNIINSKEARKWFCSPFKWKRLTGPLRIRRQSIKPIKYREVQPTQVMSEYICLMHNSLMCSVTLKLTGSNVNNVAKT